MNPIFTPVVIEKPSDKIIDQIKGLISRGDLKPGDRLPPERQLAEQFKVSRNYVREAIKQLELYGILTTKPQSGTVVSSLGVRSLEGFIRTAIGNKQEFADLIEVRRLLEIQGARQAAERAGSSQKEAIGRAHGTFLKEAREGGGAVEEDLAFHLAIADASGNPVLRTFLGIITPDIIGRTRESGSWTKGRIVQARKEHGEICRAILAGEGEAAARAMSDHMDRTRDNFHAKGAL